MPTKTNTNNAYCNHYQLDSGDIEYLICHVALLWRKLLNHKTKHLGINGTERRVLMCIARNPGLTQTQVASLIDLEPQNLIRSLDKLESLHWIKKCGDAKDRRTKCLLVTDEAEKVIMQIKAINDGFKPVVLAAMDEKKTQQLIRSLTDIRENLFNQLESTP